jgi:hypothetical protein
VAAIEQVLTIAAALGGQRPQDDGDRTPPRSSTFARKTKNCPPGSTKLRRIYWRPAPACAE